RTFFYTLILCAGSALITYLLVSRNSNTNGNVEDSIHASVNTAPAFSVHRLDGYSYIHPLMFVEPLNKSPRYADMTQSIAGYIESKKQSRDIVSASFYLKDMSTNEWTGYNEGDKYLPGSLIKVPVLITYLRLEEQTPGVLNKQFFYKAPFSEE